MRHGSTKPPLKSSAAMSERVTIQPLLLESETNESTYASLLTVVTTRVSEGFTYLLKH